MGTTDKKKSVSKYKRGDLLYIDLGSTQGVAVENGLRPCVVVSNDISNRVSSILNVFPLTTHFKECPVHVRITSKDVKGYLMKESEILMVQPRTVSKNKVRSKIGFVSPDSEVMKQINRAILHQFACIVGEEDADVTQGE